MIRSALIEKLNKYVFLQYIFVIFPLLMVVIYGYAYMTDMLSVARNLEVNNAVSERAWEMDELREVQYVEDDNGVVKTVVSGSLSSIEDVSANEVIFYVQMYNIDWYQVVTKSGSSGLVQQCSLFDAEFTGEDDVIRVTHGDISQDFYPGDLVCCVTISGGGAYRVTFVTEEEKYYELDYLPMCELLPVESGGGYRVRVTTNYELEVGDEDVNFCSNLPTDNLYYNEDTQSFVRNVSKDYPWTFMLRVNLFIVILSVALYDLLLWRIAEERKLSLLENRTILRVDMFAACLLPLAALLTLMML